MSNTTKFVAERGNKPHVKQRDERGKKESKLTSILKGNGIYNVRAKTSQQ